MRMLKPRLIARLDVKAPNLVKGIHLEGLRVMGDPQEFATRYYEQGANELIYIDIVASLYGRNNLTDIVRRAAENVFIPITVGGGIRSADDVKELLRCGADKVAINTMATKNPQLIKDVARRFGSQCMVLSIEAIKTPEGWWEVYTENGREKTGLNVIDWVQQGVELGAGEILLTSIDREGTRKGFDIELTRQIAQMVPVPVIASGGLGTLDHLTEVLEDGFADAVAVADALHYNRLSMADLHQTIDAVMTRREAARTNTPLVGAR